MHMTENERKMLNTIVHSDYNINHDNPVNNDVWLWDVCDRFGRSASGIMSSLVKKGWAVTTGHLPGDEPGADEGTCNITQAGYDALQLNEPMDDEFQDLDGQ